MENGRRPSNLLHLLSGNDNQDNFFFFKLGSSIKDDFDDTMSFAVIHISCCPVSEANRAAPSLHNSFLISLFATTVGTSRNSVLCRSSPFSFHNPESQRLINHKRSPLGVWVEVIDWVHSEYNIHENT